MTSSALPSAPLPPAGPSRVAMPGAALADESLRPAHLGRREALGRLGLLLAAGLWPGRVSAGAPDAPAGGPGATGARPPAEPVEAFRFAALNDLHHASPECDAWFEQRFAEVAAHRPEFVLLLGDLAHRGEEASLTTIRRLADRTGVPVYAVPGNHDNDVPGDTSLYARIFPGHLNYTIRHRGWQFVALDTTQGTAWREIEIPEPTFAWLAAEIPRLDPRAPTVLCTHFPLATGLTTVHGHPMTPRNAEAVLQHFVGLNLRAAFSGHLHGRTRVDHRGATLLTGATCSRVDRNHDGTDQKGWWLCHASADGNVTPEFVPLPKPA